MRGEGSRRGSRIVFPPEHRANGAIRHGWGCAPDPGRAVTFLSAAASNAAEVENMALRAGLRKGGAAKGELVLAIFELANCFRHGWGIPRDPVAAKQVGWASDALALWSFASRGVGTHAKRVFCCLPTEPGPMRLTHE